MTAYLPSFPKIFHLGTHQVQNLFHNEVEITEKIDGSQFQFGVLNGKLHMKTKNVATSLGDNNQLFHQIHPICHTWFDKGLLREGFVFHGEYLSKQKHNTLKYDRVPKNHFVLFGITDLSNLGRMYPWEVLCAWADTLDCDVVPRLFHGTIGTDDILELVNTFLDKESVLGGPKIEGVVIKNYAQPLEWMGRIFPITCGKFVSEAFKELHHKNDEYMSGKNKLQELGESFANAARWNKAIQYLRDAGELKGEPADIGPLMKRLNEDLIEEHEDYIKNSLYSIYKKDVIKLSTRGFPQWYKEQLVKGEINAS